MPLLPAQWTETVTVNTNTANTQQRPRIIQLENGDIIIAWETNDPTGVQSPSGFDIVAQRFDQGGNAIGGEFQLNTGWWADDEMDLGLASVPGAGFLIVYADQDSAVDLRLENFDSDGTRREIHTIIDDGIGLPNYQNPEIAVSSSRSALIVYEEVNAGGSDLLGKTYDPLTNILGAEFAIISGTSIVDASISVLTNGNYVIVGTEEDGLDTVYMRIVTDTGANVLSATEVSGTGSNSLSDSGGQVQALTGGGFVVAWENDDTVDRDIRYQVYNADGTENGSRKTFPGAGVNLADENYTELRITALSDGGFAILADNQTEYDLRLQRFSATGATVGSLIEISDVNETNIDITLLVDGRMAMVYNNGSDIRMQIFDTRDNPTAGASNIGIGTALDDTLDEFTAGFGSGIFAGAGDDLVYITEFAGDQELFDGGEGIDTLRLELGSAASTIDLLAGTRIRNADASRVDIVLNFENATSANGDDALYGNDGANVLTGLSGNDVLWGRGGADTLIGGKGDDTYIVDDIGDVIIEAVDFGNDTVYTSLDYTLSANVDIGVNNAVGSAGSSLSGNELDNVLILSNTSATGASIVNGGAGNDTIYVQNNTTVNAGNGEDVIVLNGDNNTAQGGAKDDVYIVIGDGNNVSEEDGYGIDTVYSYTADFTLGDHIETLALITFDGNFAQNGTGNSLANTIIGGGSNNVLAGYDGGDFLIGGGGDDILIGGVGLDVMQGNVGNDSFFYNGFAELGDIIQDWVNTDDSFVFSGLAFGIGAGTSLIDGVNFVSSTAPSSVAAQATFLWDSDDYDLYYDGDGTGTGVSAVLVASLQDFSTVDVTDFVFF